MTTTPWTAHTIREAYRLRRAGLALETIAETLDIELNRVRRLLVYAEMRP